jgi:hypothetical protein
MSGSSANNAEGVAYKQQQQHSDRLSLSSSLEDWRQSRPGRRQKMAYLLDTNQFTDVSFMVGSGLNSEVITAHRLVLTMYSSVFEAMFQGPLAANAGELIALPDIEPEAFKCLLKVYVYIYIVLNDHEQCMIDIYEVC